MAAPRDYKSVIDGGGMIRWDWKNNKYVFINKDQLNKELNKLEAHKPSPYEAHARIQKSSSNSSRHRSNHRPSYKIQGKHACRPLRQQNNRNDKLLSSSGKIKLKVHSPKKQLAVLKKPPAVPDIKPVQKKDRIIVHDKENMPLVHDGKGDGPDVGEKVSKPRQSGIGRPPRELSCEHATFTSIISSRLIHIKAAKTFWRQSPDAFLSYLVKTEDDAVTVDVLPVIIHHLQNGTSTAELVTMGICLELIPTLRRLLDSKIEDYVKTSLDMLRTILRYWWNDLKTTNKEKPGQNLLQSRSIPEIYTSITAMLDKVHSLTKRKAEVASKAKIVEELLRRL